MIYGNIPRDGGFYTFNSKEELDDFLNQEKNAKQYIHRFIGAREFINNIDRWFLLLENCQLSFLIFRSRKLINKLLNNEIITAEKFQQIRKLYKHIQKEKDYFDRVEVEQFRFNRLLHNCLIEKNPSWKRATHFIRLRFLKLANGEIKYYVF